MYQLLKPLLFLLPAERAHLLTTKTLDIAAAFPPTRWLLRKWFVSTELNTGVEVMGLKFPNKVGLAAGFDKNAEHIEGLACLGFGFLELGTVTPLPQGGNPKPRLFRLPADRALINRMGFNNEGLDAMIKRLQAFRASGKYPELIIGGNIGKNKVTPNEEAVNDYLICFDGLFDLVDYFVVNVSSPNTPNLRALQEKEPLTKLLSSLQERNNSKPQPKPILLKIAPDLTNEQLDDIAEIVKETKLAGIIATNTTISRENLHTKQTDIESIGAGGLSGSPVLSRSTEIIFRLREKIGTELVVVGVGGIDSPEAAQQKLDAGANLVQLYSGLIYEGPTLVRRIIEKSF
jgi:dihydroorotate dehydrogenase